ncbi:TRAP transporter fused permease subunit [Acuticoccus sp. MNP-M23]|uniref:TRAP transporter permease n=1 Tax=Acuticoccus sp. MNP-M23 TaxID=3072793 RepID=UPI0028169D15|nr:TRAP transporter fused permease subunit [Acuticoccus sp. MNP-M23]WMS41526.1 TRAP transporter fused permease subunit [Acuticoccus sp. MNP-M23]
MPSALKSFSRLFTDKTAGPAAALFGIVGVGMAVLHMYQIQTFHFPSGLFKAMHLTLALLLSLLGLIVATPVERRWARRLLSLLALVALVPFFYMLSQYQALIDDRAFFPNTPDLIVAVLLLALSLFVAAREWGLIIPGIAVLGLLYGYFGFLMPGDLLYHNGFNLERLIGYTSIPYFRGLLGGLTAVSASTIFIYMLFAGLLKSTGGLDLLMKIAFALSGKSRAGPAQAAVIGSGFMGMISGSTMANVASTGAFTIPMMKRFGFKPHFAGAVEAVASAGGQITPPKMGLAAFLIVGITGIPYVEIIAAATLPAIIYYGYLMFAVHIQAVKLDLGATHEARQVAGLPLTDVSMLRAFLMHGHPILAVTVLIWLLLTGSPANTAALCAVEITLALEVVKRVVLGWRTPVAMVKSMGAPILGGLARGAHSGAQVAVVVAVISIMVEMLSATGLAQKLSYMMLDLAGESLWPLVFIAALTCLVFGVGMPTSAAYILVALLGAPALIDLGVPVLAAHLFVFYLANMSAITPPVAVGCLVAANIAEAPFMKTSFTAVRLGLPGFLLPMLFIARPELLGLGAPFWLQLLTALLAGVALVAINIALEGTFRRRLHVVERIALLPAAFCLFHHSWWTTAVGIALFAVVIGRQFLSAPRPEAAAA